MTGRQRMRLALRRQRPDRVPVCDSFWDQTLANWREQGHIGPEAHVNDLFGLQWRLVHLDSSFMLPEVVLEQTKEFIVRRNAYGVTGRYRRGASAPAELLDFPVKTRTDWDRLKHRLRWHPDRFALTGFYSFTEAWQPPEQDWAAKLDGLASLRATGDYVALYCYDAFEATWRKMGHEQALVALVDDPRWMREMFEAQIDLLTESVAGMLQAGATVDGLFLASDLAYKTGLMFSPRLHRELCLPGLRRLCDFCHRHDLHLIFHCDGDMRALLPNLVEAKVDCVQPLEVNAGLDVRQLKREYGDRLCLMGNIAPHEMALPAAQAEDLLAQKLTVAGEGGGYIYHSDHSIPPDMPFERYMQVLEWVRRYGEY